MVKYRRNWMQNIVIAGLLLELFPLGAKAETARWDIDLDHSAIEFRVAHMVISKTAGRFMDYRGFVDMDAEAKTLKTIEATIKTESINTNHDKRDAHLRNADFLDTKQFPTMTYKMKSYQKEGEIYKVVGNLTLRGVTREVTLRAEVTNEVPSPFGGYKVGVTATGTILREEFGVSYNQVLEAGGVAVGKEVAITIEAELDRS